VGVTITCLTYIYSARHHSLGCRAPDLGVPQPSQQKYFEIRTETADNRLI
jgi:hypothetical protein